MSPSRTIAFLYGLRVPQWLWIGQTHMIGDSFVSGGLPNASAGVWSPDGVPVPDGASGGVPVPDRGGCGGAAFPP